MPDIAASTTPVWEILGWIIYGAIRWVLLFVPLVNPPSVDRSEPWQWYRYNDWYDWAHRDDENGGPDQHWLESWFKMCLGEFKLLVLETAQEFVDTLEDGLLVLIGGVRYGFNSLGTWVQWLNDIVGDNVPYFADSLSDATSWLYARLPVEIRLGWESWNEIWDGIKAAVRQWAMDRYDQAKAWASAAMAWVSDLGQSLLDWRARVASWIDNFRSDPYGYVSGLLGSAWSWLYGFWIDGRSIVIGWLGPDWASLVLFARDCLTFYYNLWASGWGILSAIVSDPVGWVYARLERALLDRW